MTMSVYYEPYFPSLRDLHAEKTEGTDEAESEPGSPVAAAPTPAALLSSQGGGSHRPATRERSNGRMALTVLKPKLATLGEGDEASSGMIAAEASGRSGIFGVETTGTMSASEGGAGGKNDTVSLKVMQYVQLIVFAILLHVFMLKVFEVQYY